MPVPKEAQISQAEMFAYSAQSVQLAITRIIGSMSKEELHAMILSQPDNSPQRHLLVRLASMADLYMKEEWHENV